MFLFSRQATRGRGIYGGKTHGCGSKGSGQRQNFMRLGYETGNNPFYLRFPTQNYYKGHHLRLSYTPLCMGKLQRMIDTARLRTDRPVDVSELTATGLFSVKPYEKEGGFMLQDDGIDHFQATVNLEVQWASEAVIAAVERNGGTITVAYYDPGALLAAVDPMAFFRRGVPIPRRMLPPQNLIDYYSDPKNRGYLADPAQVAKERFILAQKYGYALPDIRSSPHKEMLLERKDPRQIFYGLQPGWVVSLKDKLILKPTDPELQQHYAS
ncbi:39S ribosomal protein L15, mitochondrial [Chionoecetes opilio]|uniref:Large ribosomal subunit protein uL15m n=1 Tax=Chionoecetes opilio TaxID=41210 RepID=A0A8J5CSK0_CHIOP|nr:39S ribosomal protein L15, mitochondrial [Chionoecetes opilio]